MRGQAWIVPLNLVATNFLECPNVFHSRLAELVTKGTVQPVDRAQCLAGGSYWADAEFPRASSRAFAQARLARHESGASRYSQCHYARCITMLFTAQAMR